MLFYVPVSFCLICCKSIRREERIIKKSFLYLIKFYQKCISPHFPCCCRFMPTCSQYAYEAISEYGIIRGVFLSFKRVLRCNPLFKGGYDPVP